MDELTRLLEQQLAGENRIAQQITAFETAALDPLLTQQATSTASQGTADFLAGLVTPGSAPNIAAFSAGLEQSAVAAKTSAQERVLLAEQQRAAKVKSFERELAVAREERDAATALRAEGREIASSDQRLKLQRAQTQTAELTAARTEATQAGAIAATNAQSESTVRTTPILESFNIAQAGADLQNTQAGIDLKKTETAAVVAQQEQIIKDKQTARTELTQLEALDSVSSEMSLALQSLFEQGGQVLPTEQTISTTLRPAILNIIQTDPVLKELPSGPLVERIIQEMHTKAGATNKQYGIARASLTNAASSLQRLENLGAGGTGDANTTDKTKTPAVVNARSFNAAGASGDF